MEKYTLNNGIEIPKIGFGCYTAEPKKFIESVKNAFEAGFTYFDTASIYETERMLAQAIKESGISRKEIQIASKAWTDEMGYREVKEAFYRSLERLDTDYLDVYMIHWPKRLKDQSDWKEINLETWRAMEELHDEGLVKSLGMSNFLPHHLNVILENCKVKPVIDQLEVHPGLSQEAAVRYCIENAIQPQAHSSLGRGLMVNNPVVSILVEKYGKTVPQICLRFLVQKGICPITYSSKKPHMLSNIDIFDFEIREEDMWLLSCMPQTYAVDDHPDFSDQDVLSNFEQ